MTNVSEKSEKSVEKKTATSTGATVINYKGVHHLSGIFCNVVDVKSEEEAGVWSKQGVESVRNR